MSIVEKALQKAQAEARVASASRTAAETAVPAAPTRPAEPTRAPAEAAGARSPASGDSLTSRDLKALVHVDMEYLRSQGRLASEDSAGQVEEEMRRIKWPLLAAIAGRGDGPAVRNNVVLVTSAAPGEGKTFTSLNLALSIVRDREMRVILVDGDVARPGLTPALRLEGRAGLNDILEHVDMDVNEVTYQTDVEGLFFVPAGKWHERSPEFFAGSRMPQVIEQLVQRVGNGVIIVDSPPLLATNDAQAVTRYAGLVLMVVKADVTEQRAVLDALALVDKSTPVRAVLNQVRPSLVSRYYGQYYYGYDYARSRKKGDGGRS
jgi:receptor protein-tyrosine kinase